MSDPYAGDPGIDPLRPERSGTYTEGTLLYTSSIDASITDLELKYSVDNGCAASPPAGGLPILVQAHGYGGDDDSFVPANRRAWAARGFICASVNLRGRKGLGGVRTNRTREQQDYRDALTALRALLPYASATRASLVGYSDGGGGALMERCCSDAWTVVVAHFPLIDYGDPYELFAASYGWYDDYAGAPALLDADIGGSPTTYPKRYAARNVRRAIERAQLTLAAGSPDGWTYVLHDEDDPLVSVTGSDALDDLGLPNWSYTRTTAASPTRALHGHPEDNGGVLKDLEPIYALSCYDRPALVLPTRGTITVMGHFESMTRDFRVWLDAAGSTGDPRTNGTGGMDRVATLTYDTDTGTMMLTPRLGAMRCSLRMGGVSSSVYLDENRTTVFDAGAGTVSQIAPMFPAGDLSFSRPVVFHRPVATPARPVAWATDKRRRTVIG